MEYEQIKKLMDDMGNSKIDTINIEFPDGTKINMQKNKTQIDNNVGAAFVTHTREESPLRPSPEEHPQNDQHKTITSPMVGTFYSSSSPDKEPFVKVGDWVKKGDTLCIIEAMKLMNEIESEHDGTIVEICINNGDMVEYGKELFKIC